MSSTFLFFFQELCIELLTVVHRLLLSNDDPTTQQTILHIVWQCALAFQEKIYSNNDEDDDDNGGERANHHAEGEIIAKKSVVFSLLEICTFMVSKYAGDVISEATSNQGNVSRKIGTVLLRHWNPYNSNPYNLKNHLNQTDLLIS